MNFNPKPGIAQELAPGIRRILAPNPSAMTFKGTNTYLVGNRDIVVIDPGPPDEAHLSAIMSALKGHQRISHIAVTHSHVDHSPLAMVLAQFTGAKVYGFGSSTTGRASVMDNLTDLGGGEGVDETYLPDVKTPHLGEITGSDWLLRALHTPGHMGNHLCFELDWTGQFSGHVFSGDLVMGWATSMVSPPDGHLTDFMASLELLETRSDHMMYHPGHGAPVQDPQARVRALWNHRKTRERQILEALQQSSGHAAALTALIYTDVDPRLLPAATRNVLAHLIDLTARQIVAPKGTLREDVIFVLA
ncbi:MBL fold metallo-hydrolase [Litoreibacter sp.]|nr:MBL fold metallo-hydrolase [Litoreibacter sp.]